jgi:hypothetical protein
MVERAKSANPAKAKVLERLRDTPKVDKTPAPQYTGTVTVACKLPNGLILRLFKMHDIREQTPTGVRISQQARQEGQSYTVRGPRIPFGQLPNFMIIGDYALTPNIPRDFWEEWSRQNEELDCVKNKLIYAHEKQDHVADWAKDHAGTISGLEPIDPEKPPREFRLTKRGVTLEPATKADLA